MSEENVQKQILIRIDEQYHSNIKDIAEKKGISMNKWIVDVLVENLDSGNDSEDDQNDSAVVDVLRAQIDKKDDQIEKLQELVARQQQLSLLEKQEKEKILLEIDNEAQSDEPNRSFWARWFRS